MKGIRVRQCHERLSSKGLALGVNLYFYGHKLGILSDLHRSDIFLSLRNFLAV